MSMDNKKAATAKTKTPEATPPATKVPDAIPAKTPPLFRRIDWITFLVTALCVWAGYFWTLAPNLGLEDSGELAVAERRKRTGRITGGGRLQRKSGIRHSSS